MEIPDTQLVKEVMAYARRELSVETLNHSMRVYYWGEYNQKAKMAGAGVEAGVRESTEAEKAIGSNPCKTRPR